MDAHDRPSAPHAGDEASTLLGALDRLRATVARKCAGLDAAGLRTALPPSAMTLGGMLKHLADVEDRWCSHVLHARDRQPPWDTGERAADRDWAWRSAADDTPEELRALWRGAVARSRVLVGEALADGGLDRPARRPAPDGRVPSLRWVLVHLVEEYARHCGHADLLREAVDGATGE